LAKITFLSFVAVPRATMVSHTPIPPYDAFGLNFALEWAFPLPAEIANN